MPPALIAAGIGAVGTIGGALISSGAQSHAISQANQSQQAATQAQLQLGQQSLGLNRDIYNSNYNLLSPFVGRGNIAGEQINAMLGLPEAPQMTSPLATTAAPGTGAGASGPMTLDQVQALQHDGIPGDYHPALAAYNANLLNPQSVQHVPTPVSAPIPVPSTGQPPAAGSSATNALSPTDALNNFANSAGMQFQLKQGENAIQSGYAARGALQSGAAMKALQSYGQNTALNNYFMPYMNLLGGQQGVGAQAGSAVAGVGSSFGNAAANINAQNAGVIQSGADAAGNAALARGAIGGNTAATIGSALGTLGSSFFAPNSLSPQNIQINGGTSAYFAQHPFGP